MIIDGFKSYATRTVISGWDSQFNAITGLNGSGKSNILDAICFVLGISSMATVRASNLQDLIYKRGQAGVTKLSVTIVFDNLDKAKSPIGFESHNKISVTRQIALGGTSKYLVNGHRAQQQNVLQLFQSVQLNINNPNFLIMQGKITKVLNMRPDEILSLIEEAAGTKMYEDRREKAQKTMAKKDVKLHEIRTLLVEEIEPKLEKLRNDKKFFIDFQTTQSELETLSRAVAAHDYNNYRSLFVNHSKVLKEKQDYYEASKAQVEKLSNEITSLQEELASMKKRKEEELSKEGTLKDLEKSETDLQKEITRLTTSLELLTHNIEEEKQKLQNLNTQTDEAKSSSKSTVNELAKLTSTHDSLQTELRSVNEELAQKEDLLSTLTTGLSSKGASDGGYMSQLQEMRTRINDCNVSINKSRLQQENLRQELSANKPKLEKAKLENLSTLKELENQKSELNRLTTRLEDAGFNLANLENLKMEEAKLQKEYRQLSYECEQLKRKILNLDFTYNRPTANFDDRSVKGVAAKLVSVPDENLKSALALEVSAGGKLYNVVVDTDDVGAQLLEKGQLRRRVTIIPLNKVSLRKLDSKVVKFAKDLCPGKVELALNLVGFDKSVGKAMEYIFGNKLICEDPETAKQVTFHPQIRAASVTLQGDSYDPSGTLSGGSRRNNGSVLANIQQFQKSELKLLHLRAELDKVQLQINKELELSEKTKSIQKEKQLIEHQITILERNLQSNPAANILKKSQEDEELISSLDAEIKEQEELVKSLEAKVVETEKDMKEFSSNKGSKLKQLQAEIDKLKKRIPELEKKASDAFEQYESAKIDQEQLESDMKGFEVSINDTQKNLKVLAKDQDTMTADIRSLELSLSDIRAQLEAERSSLMEIDEELEELTKVLSNKSKSHNSKNLEIQKLSHELEKFGSTHSSIESKLNAILEENDWINDDKALQQVLEQYPNINLKECHERVQLLTSRYQGMKRKVNSNIMSTMDRVEKHEASLKQMIKKIETDKSKIEQTINTLNDYKRTTLVKTWEKVSVDFGNIFGDLLPNSFAKLVPPEGKDVTEGLEVKVKLGSVWKQSLVELSGGQRSLIALSLIMALLQFKPAPMYILDEVDAALDLSHTQNIGHLIRTRFKGSQFIVVSLKEGMFTNANRVFRTRFQDGTSIVSVL